MKRGFKHTNLLVDSSRFTQEDSIVQSESFAREKAQDRDYRRPAVQPRKGTENLIVLWNLHPGRTQSFFEFTSILRLPLLITTDGPDVHEVISQGRVRTLVIEIKKDPENILESLSQMSEYISMHQIQVLIIGDISPQDIPPEISDFQYEIVPSAIDINELKRHFMSMLSFAFPLDNRLHIKTPEPHTVRIPPVQMPRTMPRLQVSRDFETQPTTPEIPGSKSAPPVIPLRFGAPVDDRPLPREVETQKRSSGLFRETPAPAETGIQEPVSNQLLYRDAIEPDSTPPNQVTQQVIPTVSEPPPPAPVPEASAAPDVKVDEQPDRVFRKDISLYDQIVDVVSRNLANIEDKIPINLDEIFSAAQTLIENIDRNSEFEIRALNRREFNSLPNRMVNTAVFALIITRLLNLSGREITQLTVAALTHDFGMTLIPQAILGKTEKLTASEIKVMRKHPEYSCHILRDSYHTKRKLDPEILDIIYQVHERMNGKGYPQGLDGPQIHPLAQVLAVADVFEAFSHPRHYRRSFVAHEAVQEIARLSGTELASNAVKALVKELSLFPIDSFVVLNNGEMGRVVSINKNHPLRPVVDIFYDSKKIRLDKPRREDLKLSPFLYIVKALLEKELPKNT